MSPVTAPKSKSVNVLVVPCGLVNRLKQKSRGHPGKSIVLDLLLKTIDNFLDVIKPFVDLGGAGT